MNFAVFSAHATQIDVCLFDPETGIERERLPLPERTGDVWHGFLPGVGAGLHYGLRAFGPWDPGAGQRFNPAKLLIDPYARRLSGPVRFHRLQRAYAGDYARAGARPDPRDSAPVMPRCIVTDAAGASSPRPRHAAEDVLIWEVNVRGASMERQDVPQRLRGRFDALAEPWLLDHLTAIGVTTVELLPIHAWMDEPMLVGRGLVNYWGYNSVNFFTPEWRLLGPAGIDGFRAMVDAFHGAGIEVVLDVVYNHTAEADERGPTLCWRGLDNVSYYLLDPRAPDCYLNWSGCGNTLAVHRPYVLRQVLDSLRYWVETFGVDGFRFDLATTLAREPHGFDPEGGFLDALRQDPLLADTRLIVEPWDVGPDGYRVGAFPPEIAEWNDGFRDCVRSFWRGDQGSVPAFAHALLGSSGRYARPGHAATRSINLLSAHDGFTLADVTSYNHKHNEANGEDNRDGHAHNLSDNCGVEGPTDDPVVLARRARRQRSLLATLFLAQGTPMLLAGDEWGNSQGGNNNAYCQDNPTGWLNWEPFDDELVAFVRRLAAFRRAHPALRQRQFLHGVQREQDGKPDVVWRQLDGSEPDWRNPALDGIVVIVRTAATTPHVPDDEVLIACNKGTTERPLALPDRETWVLALDTARPACDHELVLGNTRPLVAPGALVALVREHAGDA